MTFVAFQTIFNGIRVSKIHKYGFSMWYLHVKTHDFDDGILRIETALIRMCLSYFLDAHLNINLCVFNRSGILCSLIFVHTKKPYCNGLATWALTSLNDNIIKSFAKLIAKHPLLISTHIASGAKGGGLGGHGTPLLFKNPQSLL